MPNLNNTQTDFIYLDNWCILSVTLGDIEMDVVKGIIKNGAVVNLKDGAVVVSKQIEYFDAFKSECVAGRLFYKLDKPNKEWLQLLYDQNISLDIFNIGHRTNA